MTTEASRARAARLHAHGKALVVEEVDVGSPGDDEVAVDIAFAGVNPVGPGVLAGGLRRRHLLVR